MTAQALILSRPHWKTASALLLAGAVLFAADAARAEPRGHEGRSGYHERGSDRGGRDRHDRGRHHQSERKWGHHGGYGHHDRSSRNRFSLSIGSGYFGQPYAPYYAQPYYAPVPVVVTAPPSYYPGIPVQYETQYPAADDGRYCREYSRQVWVGGRMQESYGQACLQPDGAWQIDS